MTPDSSMNSSNLRLATASRLPSITMAASKRLAAEILFTLADAMVLANTTLSGSARRMARTAELSMINGESLLVVQQFAVFRGKEWLLHVGGRFPANLDQPLRQSAGLLDLHPRQALAQCDGHRRGYALSGKGGQFASDLVCLFAFDVHAHIEHILPLMPAASTNARLRQASAGAARSSRAATKASETTGTETRQIAAPATMKAVRTPIHSTIGPAMA